MKEKAMTEICRRTFTSMLRIKQKENIMYKYTVRFSKLNNDDTINLTISIYLYDANQCIKSTWADFYSHDDEKETLSEIKKLLSVMRKYDFNEINDFCERRHLI